MSKLLVNPPNACALVKNYGGILVAVSSSGGPRKRFHSLDDNDLKQFDLVTFGHVTMSDIGEEACCIDLRIF